MLVAVTVTVSTVASFGAVRSPVDEIVNPSVALSSSTLHVTSVEGFPTFTTLALNCRVEPSVIEVAPPSALTVTLVIDGTVDDATVFV